MISGGKTPVGCRDWRLISVAHEEAPLNDIRAILGNDIAVKAYRGGKVPFPDGAIIAPSSGVLPGVRPLLLLDVGALTGWLAPRRGLENPEGVPQ